MTFLLHGLHGSLMASHPIQPVGCGAAAVAFAQDLGQFVGDLG
jgi:hypothetical protein